MEEFVDILDIDGNATGNICLKSEAHRFGYWHACVHIWFYTQDDEILIQKRIDSKDTFPDLWDVSVAGHIGAGEIPVDAAQREVLEEIGLEVQIDELKWIGIYKSDFTHHKFLTDREFHQVYIAKLTVPVEKLVLQKEEVSKLKLIPLYQLKEIPLGKTTTTGFVPYSMAYFKMVSDAIEMQKRIL